MRWNRDITYPYPLKKSVLNFGFFLLFFPHFSPFFTLFSHNFSCYSWFVGVQNLIKKRQKEKKSLECLKKLTPPKNSDLLCRITRSFHVRPFLIWLLNYDFRDSIFRSRSRFFWRAEFMRRENWGAWALSPLNPNFQRVWRKLTLLLNWLIGCSHILLFPISFEARLFIFNIVASSKPCWPRVVISPEILKKILRQKLKI